MSSDSAKGTYFKRKNSDIFDTKLSALLFAYIM